VVNILNGVLSGAAIVVCGALYASLLAYSRKRRSRLVARSAEVVFVLLALCAVALVVSLRLEGLWLATVAVLVVGCRFAPAAIWRLCIGTHAEQRAPEDSQ
jgi:ABC-type dipeptide/oligopeptide/nickel transport system permease subunit